MRRLLLLGFVALGLTFAGLAALPRSEAARAVALCKGGMKCQDALDATGGKFCGSFAQLGRITIQTMVFPDDSRASVTYQDGEVMDVAISDPSAWTRLRLWLANHLGM